MPSLELRPFEAADVPAAAALLAERHRRHRLAQPLLAARYESAAGAQERVAEAASVADASGAVAVRGGTLVGYLVGAPKPDAAWGPNVWVESAGLAVAEAEVARDLYAMAASRWAEEGRTAHYVVVPASDVDLVRAWFRLGFGHQHSHGLRPPARLGRPDRRVRPAERRDIDALARLDIELSRHQRRAPTFSTVTVPSLEEARAEWDTDIDSSEYATFVIEQDGAVVGSAVACALEKSRSHTGLARPDNAGLLGFAAVFPHARGAGAGRALGEAVLDWAARSGFDSVVADWRATNLLSSRAWPALGFAESFLRLHRLLGY
jgi:ribosomal protein S18 acetylase RimI-like enzyme